VLLVTGPAPTRAYGLPVWWRLPRHSARARLVPNSPGLPHRPALHPDPGLSPVTPGVPDRAGGYPPRPQGPRRWDSAGGRHCHVLRLPVRRAHPAGPARRFSPAVRRPGLVGD